jgi:OOP family OmpA-OmpF porin
MPHFGKILIPLIFSLHFSFGQVNLVMNGDFEEFKNCPKDFVKNPSSFACQDWTSPNQGTPDYFNKCSKAITGIPENFAGIRNAYSGNAYSGIVCFVKGLDFKEYLQGKLSQALQKDKKYIITFHVSWGTESTFMIDEIGLKFSPSLLFENGSQSLYDPDLSYKLNNVRKWETCSDTFTAKGNEKFLIIGNFQDREQIQVKDNLNKRGIADKNPIVNAAYYFIDMVKLTELMEPEKVEEFPVGKYFIGEGIYFDTDQFLLNDSSNVYLDKVVQFLKEHPERKIRIEGHTDSFGSKEYNYLLSEKRANSVKDYFVKYGISKDRITIKGWGMDKPIDSRKDLQYLNRRIEILFE